MSLEHAFFYKSVNGDRVYDDTSFEHWLKKFFTSGVFLNDLQVTANEDMTVTVGAGYTNIDGKVKIFESASSLIIETAGATYPRIDSIVLERNDTERDILLKVVKGGYSSEPVPHTPVRQDGVYQLVIAQVLVNAGAVKVTQANITDTRSNTELCGIVAGAVDQIDFSQIQAQFDSYLAQYKKQLDEEHAEHNAEMDECLAQMEANINQMETDFVTWFEGIKNQLDEDAAGHLQNQIDDMKAEMELLGGSMVEVTVDDEGKYNVEGLEVNLVIDGKTYTETIPSEKVVKFTGVLEVGTAVITCVDEAQEIDEETSIEIPYYGAYETSITLKSGISYEEWVKAGGLNPSSYETLDDLLEDETAIRTLMTKKDAVDALAQIRKDDLATIINHPYIAKWVNYREYAYSTLSAIPKIKSLMDEAGMYGMYITVNSDGTWQPKGLVPTMTSDTAPYGEVSYSALGSDLSNYHGYRAVDGDTSTLHVNNSGKYWQYKFTKPTIVKGFNISFKHLTSFILQGSNDGSDWNDIKTYNATSSSEIVKDYIDCSENANYYLYYRLNNIIGTNPFGSSTIWYINDIQFYGRQLEALIPPMTNNTTPIGEASASSNHNNREAYKAFDGITSDATSCWCSAVGATPADTHIEYKFANPVTACNMKISHMAGNASYTAKLVGSNDYSKWEDVSETIEFPCTMTGTTGSPVDKFVTFNHNAEKYKYYRLQFISSNGNNTMYDSKYEYFIIYDIQLYGTPDHESRTYIYEHGVEVMPLTVNNDNTALGNITKNSDNIKIAAKTDIANNGSPYCQLYSNEIEFANYNCLCMEIDKELNKGTGSRFLIMAVTSNVPLKAGESKESELVITKPTTYLDVTSIQNKGYAVGFNNGTSAICTIATWWLE